MARKRKLFRLFLPNGRGRGKVSASQESSRPWSEDWYNAKGDYDAMRSLFFSCWACGANRKPLTYYGPWLIERAHICNKPRREDRRLVVMLCSVCHKFSHGERLGGLERPKLLVEHLLGLKQEFDRDWFDLEFLQRHSLKILPEVATLPPEYEVLRAANRGSY